MYLLTKYINRTVTISSDNQGPTVYSPANIVTIHSLLCHFDIWLKSSHNYQQFISNYTLNTLKQLYYTYCIFRGVNLYGIAAITMHQTKISACVVNV